MAETVAALSSGLVPSGVAVIRVSGPAVRFALERIAGILPDPRYAALRSFRDPSSDRLIDKGLVLFFPGPASFTGEDVAEFHCHGGRAVVDGMLQALWSLEGVGPAEAGDFTRQAFANGKLDLVQVEGVGDVIHAVTAEQLDQALDQLEGGASRKLFGWKEQLADVRAEIEADLDFSDEDDVPGSVLDSAPQQLRDLAAEMDEELSSFAAERLRDGFRVVLGGAPNSGKSTLLNAMLDRDAALVSPIAGTTRDQIDVPLDLDGLPVVLTDTAGLRLSQVSQDSVEVMGIERARKALSGADCVVWIEGGDDIAVDTFGLDAKIMIRVRSKSDLRSIGTIGTAELQVSGLTGAGVSELKSRISGVLREVYALNGAGVRSSGRLALDVRRRLAVRTASDHIRTALALLGGDGMALDHAAEELRLAQHALATITGDVDAEAVLDRVFSRFCIGK